MQYLSAGEWTERHRADRHPVGRLCVTELEVVHVTVIDAEGAIGTGFAFSVSGGAVAMRSLIDGVIGQPTIGSELEGWERRWHGLWARTHGWAAGLAVPALSAVDIAIWDLRARRAGLPLYRLVGAYRDQVPAYCSLDRVADMASRSWSRPPPATSLKGLLRSSCLWRPPARRGVRPPEQGPGRRRA